MMSEFGITKKFLIGASCLLIFFFSIFFFHQFFVPKITLNGGDVVEVNYPNSYQEDGYSAIYHDEDVTDEVVVKGNVNSKKLGEYSISYEVGKGIFKRRVVRVVKVVDHEKPKLDLTNDDIYVCPGSTYKIEEVKAVDNYDGDLTSKVHGVVKDSFVFYSVKDSSGNVEEVKKQLIYEDREKPIITLAGDEVINICANEAYHDPGFTAVDNCDKDLTKNVTVDGVVDNSLIGEYELTYHVSDQAGNEGISKRKVRVSNSDYNGVVYLTFDDGPKDGTTNVILDILKEEQVEATFFVTNSGPDELIEREYREGHTVGLHTSSHDYSRVYATDDAYFQDLQSVSDRVYRLTGERSKFIRFPGGSSNTVSRKYSSKIMSRLTQKVVNEGYQYYDWNITSGDAGETTEAHQVYLNVVNALRKDRVNMVLMHDIKPYTRDALRDIIHYCKENGYTLKKISSCSTPIHQRVNN